jgi:hypothetical protein
MNAMMALSTIFAAPVAIMRLLAQCFANLRPGDLGQKRISLKERANVAERNLGLSNEEPELELPVDRWDQIRKAR